MARREVEEKVPQVKASPDVIFRVPEIFGDINMGKNWVHYEYEAHFNKPEIVRVTVVDTHQTIFDEHMGNYFAKGIMMPPIMMETTARWLPSETGRKLETTKKHHAIISAKSSGPGPKGADQTYITFTGIDLPRYMLAAGDAGGYVYDGRISDVLEQICDKYSRGLFSSSVRKKTRDDKHNKWWQNRMDPMSFIKSLLRWSSPLNKLKTRWVFWSETDMKAKPHIEFFEQHDETPLHRSTYWWGDMTKPGPGDVIGYEMMADNSRDTWRGKLVTSGISTVSGAYHDRIVHWPDKDVVYLDEAATAKKYVHIATKEKEGFALPSTDEPLDSAIGWTRAHSLPEPQAGEIGLKYDDYIDGYARDEYYNDLNLQRASFTVSGHHIWSESIGLGYDTIDIVWRTPDTAESGPHHMHGTWIVDGFKHVLTRRKWETILYCYRFHKNASGEKVGRTEQPFVGDVNPNPLIDNIA